MTATVFIALGFLVGFVPLFFHCCWLHKFHEKRVNYWFQECRKARDQADKYFHKWTEELRDRDDSDEWKRQ